MPSSVELVCLMSAADKASVWPHVAPLLRRAIERAGLSAFRDVELDILQGDALIWIAWSGRIEAAASTSLQQSDAGLVCLITACGGADRRRWLPLLAEIEDYAKAEGCKSVRIIGRRGWLRALNGYAVKAILLDKELS